ncbi:MAG: flavin reductase family protein [Planktotalea sp.]|uniref:flavin reductase family protein n=1 Tax=Planktotalea sp. TaxID=2029877 RepID=UPI003C787CA9
MSREMPPLPLPDSFEPGADTARAFRDALGRFATGVTVITCNSDMGPLGITANSFASVSLDPALVLWSPAKASKRFEAFTKAEHFAIHIMSDVQSGICSGFSKDGSVFDGFDWHACSKRVPLISHCLSRFECTREAVHDAGDHAIVVGRVTRVSTQAGTPLMFYSGKYGGFSET